MSSITMSFIIAVVIICVILLFRIRNYRAQWMDARTQLNAAEHKLKTEEGELQAIFTHGKQCFAIIALDGTILRVNQRFSELLGYPTSDLNSLNLLNALSHHEAANLRSQIERLIIGDRVEFETQLQCQKIDGESIWLSAVFTVIRDEASNADHIVMQAEHITQQKNTENKLRHLAYHDALTKLANRAKLEQFINQLIAGSSRRQQCFAVLFMDLDGFKNVNDTIGHDAGDLLLQVVAERLRNSVRSTDLVARLGGDEFVILITDVKLTDSVAIIAKKILENVSQGILIKNQQSFITTSIGISIYPFDAIDLNSLMKCADLALYKAKEDGKNNYQYYTQEMTSKAKVKLSIKTALNQALAKNEFHLVYLPEMDIKTGKIVSVEALLRWKNNEYKDIRPDEIIGLAEESGLIIPVSEWILKTACAQFQTWKQRGLAPDTISINCTARQFKQSTFIENVSYIVNEMQMNPKSLAIEITESMIMKDTEHMLRVLDELKSLGAQIVLDDFGTGYWSIGNLRKLSVDKIKIDKTFIQNIFKDDSSSDIISAIIAMVNKLGMISVGEGVETQAQFDYLASENCRLVQGYYLTRPISGEIMTEYLKEPRFAGIAESSLD